MTSRRLPGKHLLSVNGKSIITYLISRLKPITIIDTIVIATTSNASDDIFEDIAQLNSVNIFRGPENDVMLRVLDAGKAYNADIVCEITGDCPLIDPYLVEQCINSFLINNLDYVNYGTLYGGLPDGFGSQVFTLEALARSEKLTNDPLDREHVTRHIQNNRNIFSTFYISAPNALKRPDLKLSLDTNADFLLIKDIIEYFESQKINPTCQDVINYISYKI